MYSVTLNVGKGSHAFLHCHNSHVFPVLFFVCKNILSNTFLCLRHTCSLCLYAIVTLKVPCKSLMVLHYIYLKTHLTDFVYQLIIKPINNNIKSNLVKLIPLPDIPTHQYSLILRYIFPSDFYKKISQCQETLFT